MIDCLNNLVGLSDNSDDCYSSGRPVDYDTSDSGFFITDYEYGFPVFEAISESLGGGFANVWEMITNARTKTLAGFELDFFARLKVHNNRKLNAFNGKIGNLYSSTSYTKQKALTGAQYAPQSVKDGQLVITKIFLGLDTTINPIDITISSNDPEFTPIVKSDSQSTAGQFQENDYSSEPITLPMYSDNVQHLRYFITVSPPDGTKFLTNKFYCCGRRKQWMQHLKAASFQGDEIPGDSTFAMNSTGSAYGIALEAYFSCQEENWLCSLDKVAGVEIKQAVARAIQTGAAAKVAQSVLQSTNISRYFTWTKEEIGGKYQGLKEAYTEAINFLADNYPVDATGCYECKSKKNFQKKEILI